MPRGPDPPADPAPGDQGDRRPDRRHEQEQARDRGEQTRHDEQQRGTEPQARVAHLAGRDRAGPAQLPAAQRAHPLAAQQPQAGHARGEHQQHGRTRTDPAGDEDRDDDLDDRQQQERQADTTAQPAGRADACRRPRSAPPDAERDTACSAGPAGAAGSAPPRALVPAERAAARRRRRPASSRAAPSAARASSGSSPTRVATVSPVRSGRSAVSTSRVKRREVSASDPSGSTRPLTPTVETCTTARPASTARSRDIASCWVLSSVYPKVALLVWTTSRSAPPRTVSRTMSS